MHSLEMINRLNCSKQVRKSRRANLLFNLGSEGHAKSAEKGLAGESVHIAGRWITDEEWEARKKRKRKKSHRAY